MASKYTKVFYSELERASISSAKVIVPLLVERYNPTSVIDFGCGTGAFVQEFLDTQVVNVIGLEGKWALELDSIRNQKWLQICDLNDRLDFDKKYDLAICLEVAEHLDETNSTNLIESLVFAADRVIFSAAIPGQPGTDHINLQFPEYWAEKFHDYGFCLEWDPRPSIWNELEIAPWYKQNILVYSKFKTGDSEIIYPKRMFHPDIFPDTANWSQRLLKFLKRIHKKGNSILRALRKE